MQSRLPPDTPFWWLQQSLLSLSPSLSLELPGFEREITCGRDYSRSSVFSHVPQKERIVAATRIVLGRV